MEKLPFPIFVFNILSPLMDLKRASCLVAKQVSRLRSSTLIRNQPCSCE